MTRSYQWIIDRARSGEPVPIDTTRPDIGRIVDFLLAVDGHGLAIQSDNTVNLLWVVRTENQAVPR